MEKYKGIVYAILSSVAFGLMPIFAKIAYSFGATPTSVLIYRFLLAALILFGYLKVKGIKTKVDKRSFIILFLIGLLGYTVTTQTLFISYNYLGAGIATTLHFIYPAVVCLIGFFVYKDKMSKGKIISLILAGLGVCALVLFEDGIVSSFGIFLAVISGITYGLNVIALGHKSIKHIDKKVSTMYVSFGSFVGIFLYGLVEGDFSLKLNGGLLFAYICIAVVSTIISIVFLCKAIETIGTASASILGTFEPIVSIFLGVLLFGEHLSFAIVIGTVLIIISTILLVKDK